MSEYLDEEEQIARLKSWWDENGTSIIVSILVAVVGIVGWRWYGDYESTKVHEGSDAYFDYVAGEEGALAAITSEHSGTIYHVLVLFDQARDAVAEGDLVQAEALLENAVEQADNELVGDLARIRLAKVQQGLDRSESALQTLAQIESDGYRSLALEIKGDIHSRRGELREAYESYGAAVEGLREGDSRVILEMKYKNAAPYDGEFVQPQNTLNDALERAQETLENVSDADSPDAESDSDAADEQ